MPIVLPKGVHLQGAVYHIRIGIPKDLRHLFPKTSHGKLATNAYRASLKTSDRREAARLGHLLHAEWQERFDELQRTTRPVAVPITSKLADHLVREAHRSILVADDAVTLESEWETVEQAQSVRVVPEDDDVHHREVTARLVAQKLGELTALGDLSYAEEFARAEVSAMGIPVDWEAKQARMALMRVQRAATLAWQQLAARYAGEPIQTPEGAAYEPEAAVNATQAQAAPVPTSTSLESLLTLEDIVPAWRTRTEADDGGEQRMRRALRVWDEAVGAVPVAHIERRHGAEFLRHALSEGGVSRATVRNWAKLVNALTTVAVEEGHLAANPLRLKVENAVGRKRLPWSAKDIETILMSDVMTRPTMAPRFEKFNNTEARDILAILLFTGARIGEVLQLRRKDVFRAEDSGYAIQISPEAGTVKTPGSERVVPLADAVTPWVEARVGVMQTDDDRLFPSFNRGKSNPSTLFAKWLRAFAGRHEFSAKAESHRFRHLLRSELHRLGVSEVTADAITGHQTEGTGRGTYTHVAIQTARAAVNRLPWHLPVGVPVER